MRVLEALVIAATLQALAHAQYNGTGAQFASSCQSSLWAWSAASRSYGTAHPRVTTISTDSAASYASTAITGKISATSLVTLCDGHPRVVGSATFESQTTVLTTFTERETRTTFGTDYPTPRPCSINNDDCAALWKTFYSNYDTVRYTGSLGGSPAPPCATSGTANPLTAANCTAPFLYANEARLLYWPVRTIDNAANRDIFCNKTVATAPLLRDRQLPATITGTPTSPGHPNTFVTGSLTITSPTIGVYFSGLKRADECGTTISSTIILAPPEQLSSARGVNAAYVDLPFNYADLNWRCLDAGSKTYTVQDVPGEDCYQDVQADAYFGGQDKWKNVYYTYRQDLVIANDYKPQIYPPKTFLQEASRIWGPDIQYLVEGVYDPPLALAQVRTIAGPTVPYGETVTTASSNSEHEILTTPAAPGSSTSAPTLATALPEAPAQVQSQPTSTSLAVLPSPPQPQVASSSTNAAQSSTTTDASPVRSSPPATPSMSPASTQRNSSSSPRSIAHALLSVLLMIDLALF